MKKSTQLTCRCIKVQLEVREAPIISAECHCQSCHLAADQLHNRYAILEFVNPNGGTHFVLYRKDRVQFLRGTPLLKEFRLTPESKTRRVVASCCGTPVFLEFQGGHWLSLYGCLWPEGQLPALELRTMTSDLPEASFLSDDVPNAKKHSLKFFVKLLGAWVAMGFRSPQILVGRDQFGA